MKISILSRATPLTDEAVADTLRQFSCGYVGVVVPKPLSCTAARKAATIRLISDISKGGAH